MSNQNQTTAIAASHSEIANAIFQMATIAIVGIFSVLALMNAASQIV